MTKGLMVYTTQRLKYSTPPKRLRFIACII
jgi:hypothetical protein